VHRRLDLAIIIALATITNLTYFAFSNDYFYPDSFTYLAPAKMLLSGHGFATRPGVAETMRTPGYPLLLAAFGARVVPVIVLQHILNVLLAVAIYLLVMRRLGSRFAAMAAAIVFAIDMPTIHYANKLLSETTFTALLFVAFVLAIDVRRPLLLGILCGVLVLARPVAIAWFAAMALAFALLRRPRRVIALFVAAALVLPLAWGVRNGVESGVFTVSSVAGANLLLYRAAGALAMTGDGDFPNVLAEEQKETVEEADDEIQTALHIADAQDLPHAVRTAWYAKIARRIILQHPFALALLTLRGTMVNLFESDWEALMMVSRLESTTIRLLLDALAVATIVFAAIGTIALWRRDRTMAMLIAATVGYFILISAGGEAEARFRVPVVPQIAIAAAFGLDAVRRAAAPAPR